MLRYIVLFALTVLSTTQAGGLHYASFTTAFSRAEAPILGARIDRAIGELGTR